MIALLTDDSTREADVAAMRDRIVQVVPGILVLDMAGSLAATSVLAGQRLLRLTAPQLPGGSALVMVMADTARRMLLRSGSHIFAGPDNGVFSPWLPGEEVVELSDGTGREALAEAAARAAAGMPLRRIGRPLTDPVIVIQPTPERLSGGSLRGQVLYADRFGNLITNISGIRGGRARIGPHTLTVRTTYASAAPGRPLALISSEGDLEIAVRGGHAAQELGLGEGEPVIWMPAGIDCEEAGGE